ncbi:MAG: SPOR domain-containing protein [Ignavibacteriaceae bacterium]|nr:SPOR domain-containing protein [Ignavibacteriaceae bacterium]
MIKTLKNFIFFIAILFFFTEKSFSQEFNIVSLLKKIEEGKSGDVKEELQPLLKRNPEDPSLLFLSALLTEDGAKANEKYLKIVNVFPKSKYADAALFRIFSYHTAIGDEKAAAAYLKKLKSEYPKSNYLPSPEKIAVENSEETIVQRIAPQKNENYRFTIQVGAFSDVKNAKALKVDLEDSGYEIDITEKNVAGTIFNVLYLGKFEDKKSAEKVLDKVNLEFQLNGRVVSKEK